VAFHPFAVSLSPPAWVSAVVTLVEVLILPLSGLFLLPLLIAGLVHVRGVMHGRWLWSVAWTGAVGAGIALEVLVVRIIQPIPVHPPRDWLELSIGFLAVGAAMTSMLINAGAHQIPGQGSA
jgi:hypothetical protein